MNSIKIAGKVRPIRFSHGALVQLSNHLGAKSFQDLGQKVMDMGVADLPFLTWIGLRAGAKKLGEPFDATVEQVAEWLDDEPASIFQSIMEAFGSDFGGDEEKKQTAKGKATK